MKRVQKIAISAAMVVGTGVANIGGVSAATNQAPVNLVLTIWGGSLDLQTYQARAALYTKAYPNVTISVKLLSNYDQQVETMIAGGNSPDIIEVAQDGNGFGAKGAIMNLNSYVQSAHMNLKREFGGYVGTYNYRGAQYAIPDRGGFMVMYYNKTMFNKAHLPYPNAKWTWKTFLKDAQKLTIRHGNKTTQWGLAADDWWPKFGSFIHENGGTEFNASVTVSTLNNPKTEQALQFWQDLQYKYHVSPNPIDYANMGAGAGSDALFGKGQAALMTTGLWDIATYSSQHINYGIAPMPIGKQGGSESVGTGLAVSSQSKNPQAAFDVIRFMTSVAGEQPIIDNQEDIPANLISTDKWERTLPKGVVTQSDWMAMQKEIFSPVVPPTWNQYQGVIGNDLTNFWNNKQPLEAVIGKTVADATKALNGAK